jgi:hypothetical protein
MQEGQAWVQGNLLTAALWVIALGAHLGYDYLIGQHKDIGNMVPPRSCSTLPCPWACSA